jgi:hypothetical protein
VFVNGLQLEEPTLELAEENAPEDALIVSLGDEVLPESDYLYDFSFPRPTASPTPTCGPTRPTPIAYAGVVRDTLSEADPDNAETFATNHDAFVAKAQALSDALEATRRRCRPVASSCSPTTTPTPTSRRPTAGRSSARSSRPTSRTRSRARSPASSTRSASARCR